MASNHRIAETNNLDRATKAAQAGFEALGATETPTTEQEASPYLKFTVTPESSKPVRSKAVKSPIDSFCEGVVSAIQGLTTTGIDRTPGTTAGEVLALFRSLNPKRHNGHLTVRGSAGGRGGFSVQVDSHRILITAYCANSSGNRRYLGDHGRVLSIEGGRVTTSFPGVFNEAAEVIRSVIEAGGIHTCDATIPSMGSMPLCHGENTHGSWKVIEDQLESQRAGHHAGGENDKTRFLRTGASADGSSPMGFWLKGLGDPSRGLLNAVTLQFGDRRVSLPDGKQGPEFGRIARSLLVGIAPSPSASLVVKGNSPGVGGCTLRMDHAGDSIHFYAHCTDADGNRHLLGHYGSVLDCRGSRARVQCQSDYAEALKVVTKVVALGGIFHCGASDDWQAWSPLDNAMAEGPSQGPTDDAEPAGVPA